MLALPIIAIGGIGVISVASNALPKQLADLVRFSLEGKLNEARELHLHRITSYNVCYTKLLRDREGKALGHLLCG